MKKLVLFFFALLAFGISKAAPEFKDNVKYRFSCKKYNAYDGCGSVTLGANHGSTAELYYLTTSTYSADSWWYIRKQGNGYVIVNAKSGQYMTFTNNRVTGKTKGITLTSSGSTSASEWTFSTESYYDGYCMVLNVQNPDQCFNLRMDGTYLLGSYGGSGGQNELFKIYDEQGNDVLSGSSSGGGETGGGGTGGGDTGTSSDNFATETKGKSSQGEYWERTQLKQPVVYTTSVADPVLYSIVNLRTGRYVGVGTSMNTKTTCLTEVYSPSNRTQFYFVQSGTGVQIFTKDGQYVSTNYPTPDNSTSDKRAGLSVVSGMPNGNLWDFGWTTNTYSGYTLTKLDNLSTTDATQYEYNSWNDYSLDNATGSASVHEVGLYEANDAGSSFVFTSADVRHAIYLQNQGIDMGIDLNPSTFADATDSIRLNSKQLVYDKSSNTYYYPLPTTFRQGGTFSPTFTYKLKDQFASDYLIKINGSEADTEGKLKFEEPNCTNNYSMELITKSTGEVYKSSTLRFTYLPLVEIKVPTCSGKTYTTGSLCVTAATTQGFDSTFIAAFKYRGASSSNYPKRSYAIKLRDAYGNSIDRKILGYRSDNNWILDAMYIDRACMRNRVSTDLWNDYSVKPYYADRENKVRTGTRGEFVEVFLNGSYWGLYCLTEKMDRKQLKLKKYVPASESTTYKTEPHGFLYKSKDWSYEVLMGHKPDERTFPYTEVSKVYNYLGQESWCGFEQKYPDAKYEYVDWTPLRDAVNFVATTDVQSTFDREIGNYFDLPILRDYYLLIELALATDNHGKNMFFYVYDQAGAEGNKISVCPWDMDGTFGQNWEADTTYTQNTQQDFEEMLWKHEHGQLTLFLNLKMGSLGWRKMLADRYCELRPTFFDPDKLAQRFLDYASLFADGYADIREQKKWGSSQGRIHKKLQWGAQYAARWVKNRIKYMDKRYGYEPVIDGINDAKAEAYFAAQGGAGAIAVNVGKAQTIRIYSVSGALVRTVQVEAGFTPIQGFTPGVYVVNGTKVIVK